jgi:hypothetical protein
MSDILKNSPDLTTNYIFVESTIKEDVAKYINKEKDNILSKKQK